MWEVLGSSPGRAMCFFLPSDIWWPVWVRARTASSKGTISLVSAWFWADSGTNLIKQGEIVTGRPCGSVAQWCSHGMREVLGSSPCRAMCFFLPCDIYFKMNRSTAKPMTCVYSEDCKVCTSTHSNQFLAAHEEPVSYRALSKGWSDCTDTYADLSVN